MWLLLFVPLLIIVALVFSVGALFAGVFWILGSAWPVLLIGLGMWIFMHDGRRHARADRWSNGPRALKRQAWAQKSAAQKARADGSVDGRLPRVVGHPGLPIDVQVKVEQIRRKVETLLSYADRFPPFSQDLYLVRQTADDYLPRTIDAYLALPRQAALDKPLGGNGKTAHEELKAQLDLLDSKLDDIAQDLERQDTDRLLANRRFLEARFGSRAATIDRGASGVA